MEDICPTTNAIRDPFPHDEHNRKLTNVGINRGGGYRIGYRFELYFSQKYS
jgi:hypothetical protein